MVSSASAQSWAVGSPALPGPNSTTSSPACTGSSATSTTNWSMHTVPLTRRRRPATSTSDRLPARRGTPSAYPSGTSASMASAEVRYCLLYTSDAADEEDSVDLGGRRIIKKKKKTKTKPTLQKTIK